MAYQYLFELLRDKEDDDGVFTTRPRFRRFPPGKPPGMYTFGGFNGGSENPKRTWVRKLGVPMGTPILGKLHINFWESHGISIFYVNQFQGDCCLALLMVWHLTKKLARQQEAPLAFWEKLRFFQPWLLLGLWTSNGHRFVFVSLARSAGIPWNWRNMLASRWTWWTWWTWGIPNCWAVFEIPVIGDHIIQ